jgi:predicted ATPase
VVDHSEGSLGSHDLGYDACMTDLAVPKNAQPELRLGRIRLKNFRRIQELDIAIPADAQVICLVGHNGGGKSSLVSLLVDAAFRLTTETIPDTRSPSENSDQSHRRLATTGEVGNGGNAAGFRLDWSFGTRLFDIAQVFAKGALSDAGNTDMVREVAEFLEYPGQVVALPGHSNWLWSKNPGIDAANDPLSKVVFLERPSARYEVPFYEDKAISAAPSISDNWPGYRLLPVRVSTGVKTLETFLLDMILDGHVAQKNPTSISGEYADRAIDKIRKAFKILTGEDQVVRLEAWPFRRVGFGVLNALSLLSAGELDVLVTVGAIVAQQTYLLRKFGQESYPDAEPAGVVFIDEVDSHLHPNWQQLVLPLLCELFPHVQFVVSTHSPFVLRSLPQEKTVVLRLPDGKSFQHDFSAWSTDEILRVVFDVDPEWSAEVTRDLKLFAEKAADKEQYQTALVLYRALAQRSQSLRAACDVIVSRSDIALRDLIRTAQL